MCIRDRRERLEAHGYEFKSETDTETVAHLVDYLHTGKQEDLACLLYTSRCV